MKNYDACVTIKAATANIQPPTPQNVPVFCTSRSGLAVTVGAATYDRYLHGTLPAVPVKIDGTVDQHDAEQLAAFFTELSAGLKPAPKV